MKPIEEKKRDLDFLPEAMVQEMLSKQDDTINQIRKDIKDLCSLKEKVRETLLSTGLLKNFTEIVRQRSFPTTVGVDGTRTRIMQLSMDTVAIAAVAVEGLIPPRESRKWEKPRHIVRIFPIQHNPQTDVFMRGLMFSYELELACKAPHKIVMLDGSFTSILVAIGQCLLHRADAPPELRVEIESRLEQTLANFLTVLTSPKADQMYVAIPKYTERKEVIQELKKKGVTDPILEKVDDKGLLSVSLRPWEFVKPLPLQKPSSPWHLTGVPDTFQNIRDSILKAMDNLHVMYIKPSPIHPAIRVELGSSVALDEYRWPTLLEAILDQTTSPGIFEPYPLYLADLFVSHVHGGLLELREAAIAEMAKTKEVDLPDFFLSLHDYRSERGLE